MENPNEETGVSVRQGFADTEIVRGAETAVAAMAATSKALVEARFVVAMRNRRPWENIRISVNKLCRDPGFAAEALYVKPLSATPDDWARIDKRERLRRRIDGEVKDWPMGFSIRFIEAVLFECGNFDVNSSVVWEDADKRITLISVLDLERNQGFSRTLITPKTIERSYLKKGQEPITTRYNSNGVLVYVLPANPQEMEQAEAAGVSKAIRTMGERCLPPHFKAEWRRIIEQTILDQAAKDPEAAKKQLLDNFAEKGVMPDAIERYLEHPVDALQPAEVAALRKIFVAISNAEATWRDVMEAKFGAGDEAAPESPGAKKVREALARKAPPKPQPPGDGGQAQPGDEPGPPTKTAQPAAQQPPPATGPAQGSAAPKPTLVPPASANPPSSEEAKRVVEKKVSDLSGPEYDELLRTRLAATDRPPADLPNLDDWPDNAGEAEWYLIAGVYYRWNEINGNYAKWEAPAAPVSQAPNVAEKPQPAPPAKGNGGQFAFGRKRP